MLDFSNQTPQLMMLTGIVLLGWTFVRRQMKAKKKSRQDDRDYQHAVKQMGKQKTSSLPLADAPVETQRWQVAMFELQRELKAELETKICVVQSLLNQVDQRIERLESLQHAERSVQLPEPPLAPEQLEAAEDLYERGFSVVDIAGQLQLPLGDIELALATSKR